MSYFMYLKAAMSLQQWTNNHNILFNIIIINSFKVESTSIIHNVVVLVNMYYASFSVLCRCFVDGISYHCNEVVDDHAMLLISNLRRKSLILPRNVCLQNYFQKYHYLESIITNFDIIGAILYIIQFDFYTYR